MNDPVKFLQLFGEQHWLQTFDDRKRKDRKDLISDAWVDNIISSHAVGLLSSFTEQPTSLHHENAEGAGVYFCVNQLKHFHKKRVADNVEAIRAFFVDLDGAPLQSVLDCVLKPNIVVHSSEGRWHAYWIMNDYVVADRRLFKQLQGAIAERFGGDKSVSDLCRVMRLPGFNNMKGSPFMVSYEVLRDEGYSLADIEKEFNFKIEAHWPTKKDFGDCPWASNDLLARDAGMGNVAGAAEDFEFDAARLRGALIAIDSGEYETWIRVMLALKGAATREDAEFSEDEAYEYFVSWSELNEKYDATVAEQKWQGAEARGELGLGTIFQIAKDNGWTGERRNYWNVEAMKEYLAKI